MMKQDQNLEYTLQAFVGHVNLSLINSLDTILWISVGDFV